MQFRSMTTALAALGLSAWTVAGAEAASFDCSQADTPTEHAICDNPQISRLDEQTSRLYYQVLARASGGLAQQVRNSQRSFLGNRDSCGAGYDCLIDAYTDQMMYLKTVKSNF